MPKPRWVVAAAIAGDRQQRIGDRRLHTAGQGGVGVTTEHVELPDGIGDEQRVEAARVQQLGQRHPIADVGVPDGLIGGVTPQSEVAVRPGRHGEGGEHERCRSRRHRPVPGARRSVVPAYS